MLNCRRLHAPPASPPTVRARATDRCNALDHAVDALRIEQQVAHRVPAYAAQRLFHRRCRGRHTYSAFIARSALCPAHQMLAARDPLQILVDRPQHDRRFDVLAVQALEDRSARAAWPRIAASPSCRTSKRALSATASTTVSAVIGPGGSSKASFRPPGAQPADCPRRARRAAPPLRVSLQLCRPSARESMQVDAADRSATPARARRASRPRSPSVSSVCGHRACP